MKHVISNMLFILLISLSVLAETDNTVLISEITSDNPVLEEWKTPGVYSPVNILDGNIDTCYAVREDNINIRIKFVTPLKIDEIRIMNGFGKNDTSFSENNRVSNCEIYFILKDELIGEEGHILKDQKEFQSIKLKKEYLFEQFKIFNLSSGKKYKGTKYDDYCITEIELYYKGKKIDINNINELKRDYLERLNRILVKAFTDHEYRDNDDCGIDRAIIKFSSDGTVQFPDYCGAIEPVDNCPPNNDPEFWKIENNKLYMRLSNKSKWKLYRYEIYIRHSKTDDWIHTIRIYRNPSDKRSTYSLDNEEERNRKEESEDLF